MPKVDHALEQEVSGPEVGLAMAAQSYEPDGSLHLIVREDGSNDLRGVLVDRHGRRIWEADRQRGAADGPER